MFQDKTSIFIRISERGQVGSDTRIILFKKLQGNKDILVDHEAVKGELKDAPKKAGGGEGGESGVRRPIQRI